MKKQWPLFLALCFIYGHVLSTQAQVTPLNSPIKYGKPVGTSDQIDYTANGEKSGIIWMVYIDRNGVQTSSKVDEFVKHKDTHFLDAFYVTDEEGEYLRIAKGTGSLDKDLDENGNLVKVSDYGWVHKRFLLLWSHCYATNKKIDRKAMMLNAIEGLDPKKIKASDLKKVQFHHDPSCTVPSQNVARLFDFFYIYKITPTAILLGKDASITDPKFVKKNILGWVPINKSMFWDHRVVTERNWDPPAQSERAHYDTKSIVFFEKETADAYKKGIRPHAQHQIWIEEDINAPREPGQRKRFPILNINNGVMELGAIGSVYNMDGDIKRSLLEDTQAKYNRSKDPKRNINIILVVDGTQGMDAYRNSIKTAIKTATDQIRNLRKSKNKLRLGIVVYRDEGAKKIVEVNKLKSNTNALLKTLEKESYEFNDKDVPNALYYGIQQAIYNTGINRKETNIIITIAGAADHNRKGATFVSTTDLVSSLLDYNCHLFNILVQNAHPDHRSFVFQMTEVLDSLSQKAYRKLANNKTIKPIIKRHPQYLEKPKLVPDNSNINRFVLERTSQMGGISYPSSGKRMSPERLTSELSSIIENVDEETNRYLDRLDFLIEGFGHEGSDDPNVSNFGPYLLNFLTRSGFTKDQITILREDNIQLYRPGYAPLHIEGQTYDLFKHSLFLNNRELSELIITYNEFHKAASIKNASEGRKAMKETWLKTLEEYVGGNPEDFTEQSMWDINEQVFGLPGNSEFLKNVRLKDITNESIFTDTDYTMYCSEIKKNLSQLQLAFNQEKYEYSFRSNDQKYFWISEDIIP